MPSKPPQSKATKSVKKTATKLPGKIAKRFKEKKKAEAAEDVAWSSVSSTVDNNTVDNNSIKTIITHKKKGLSKRLLKIKEREKVMM